MDLLQTYADPADKGYASISRGKEHRYGHTLIAFSFILHSWDIAYLVIDQIEQIDSTLRLL